MSAMLACRASRIATVLRSSARATPPQPLAIAAMPRFVGSKSDGVPGERLEIPRHIVDVSHSRSSGAGGQNVNKVSTKVTLRVDLGRASAFVPFAALERLRDQQRTRVTSANELLLHCDEERSQSRNLKLAFERLQEMVDAAAVEPKERIVSLEPPPAVKAARRCDKRQHSLKKAARRRGPDD